MWNTEIHSELLENLNYQIKFYGKTITMKSGRNIPRETFSWLNPEEPPRIAKQVFEQPKSAVFVGSTESASMTSIDKKLCCDCCYKTCCCQYLLLSIQLSFNLFSNTIRNVLFNKIRPDNHENSENSRTRFMVSSISATSN